MVPQFQNGINPQILMNMYQTFMSSVSTPNSPLNGMDPQLWVQTQLNTGKMSQQEFNNLRDMTNSMAPMFGIEKQ